MEYLESKEYGNPKSFCHRLRYDLKPLTSMGNAWPAVFGIYLKNGVELTLSKTFANIFDNDYQKAYKRIRQEISELLADAERNDFDAIERNILSTIFKFKLLQIYFPDRFFPVCARPTFEAYYNVVGLSYDPAGEMVYQNLELVRLKKCSKDFYDWSNHRFMRLLDFAWKKGLKLTVLPK